MIKVVEDLERGDITVHCGPTGNTASFARAHRLAAEFWAVGVPCQVLGVPKYDPDGDNIVRVRHVPAARGGDSSMQTILSRVENYLGDFTKEQV